jgi:hypothetical protein
LNFLKFHNNIELILIDLNLHVIVIDVEDKNNNPPTKGYCRYWFWALSQL